MQYRVLVKPSHAHQAWTSRGVYGSESVALSVAERLSRECAFVRVLDEDGNGLWSG